MNESNDKKLSFLCTTALGVAYAHLGTTPLYALRECFHGAHAVAITHENVLGVLSLLFWTLILLLTVKYQVYLFRANNNGEGGALALTALIGSAVGQTKKPWILLGLFGTALLYGDGMMTPAISVLSAVEGLEVLHPSLKDWVIPITVTLITGLFFVQSRRKIREGIRFGFIMMIWFLALAILGIYGIGHRPAVLRALNPIYGYRFLVQQNIDGYLVLGSIFLVAIGGEALYAKLGRYGRRPLQIDWLCLVMPCLVLNFFGQGAVLLLDSQAAANPFYHLAPAWAFYPMVLIAIMTTLIASQGVISGLFSLTRQVVQLGYAPRMNIIYTTHQQTGPIYIPATNWTFLVATVALVMFFENSSGLADAYGLAANTAMIITTLLTYFVARHIWNWTPASSLIATLAFLAVDIAFLGANLQKLKCGAWLPLMVAGGIFVVFTTWKNGRDLLAAKLQQDILPLTEFIKDTQNHKLARVQGTAVFLTGDSSVTPMALLHNIKHNKALHEQNIIVTVITEQAPHVYSKDRLRVENLDAGFQRVTVRYGFAEDPDIPLALSRLKDHGLKFDPGTATYILSHNTFIATRRYAMPLWRERLFVFLSRNASRPSEYFKLPANRIIELGMQIEF